MRFSLYLFFAVGLVLHFLHPESMFNFMYMSCVQLFKFAFNTMSLQYMCVSFQPGSEFRLREQEWRL